MKKTKAKKQIKKRSKVPAKKNRKEKRDLLEEYYGNLHVPIFVLDSNFKVIFLNEIAEDLTGHSLRSLGNKEFYSLFSKANTEQVKSAIDIVFDEGQDSSQSINDIVLTKRSGRKIHVDFGVKYLSKKKSAVITLHDLSEIVKGQKAKEKYEKEISHISKLADIGRLTAGVAHELNNPLMIIRGFAENIQLLFEQSEYDKIEILQQVDPIVKASDRMAKIIGTMMKFARDDDVYMVHVDLWEVVEDALSFLSSRLREMNIVVEKDVKSPLGVVRCDPSQIEQIILNIMNNAIHALQESPEEDRKIKITLELQDQVRLGIWNNGPSIPANIQERVMTPFFTTKDVGEGTGLGLSLSYGIMKAHDGELKFESTKEKGTEFNLFFPFTGIDENIKQVEVKRKILVVDDEAFITELLSHKLSRYGYEVLIANDGEEAQTVLANNEDIECVFTDVRMPKVDGIRLVKFIKEMDSNILIYVISGYTGRKSLEMKVKRLGINGFLTKPIDHLLFSKAISEIEDHFRYISEQKKKRVG